MPYVLVGWVGQLIVAAKQFDQGRGQVRGQGGQTVVVARQHLQGEREVSGQFCQPIAGRRRMSLYHALLQVKIEPFFCW